MIEHRDVFAPCLKHKNKIVLRADKHAATLLKNSETASTEEKLRELI